MHNSVRFILIFAICTSAYSADSLLYQYRLKLAEGGQFLSRGGNDIPSALARFSMANKIAADMNMESADAHFWLALANSDYGQDIPAIQHAKKATQINPQYANAWILLAQIYVKQKKFDTDETENAIREAMKLQPNDATILFIRGLTFYYGYNGNRKDDAIRAFQEVLKINPNHLPALFYLGLCCFDLKYMSNAISHFHKVVEQEPRHTEARFYYAVIYRQQPITPQKIDIAEQQFLLIIDKLDPNHAESHLQLGHLYQFDKPNREKSILHYRRFLETAPLEHQWIPIVNQYLTGITQ